MRRDILNIHQQQELHNFCQYWLARNKENERRNGSYEKSDTQKFWLTLIQNVFGMSSFNFSLEFEKSINIRCTGGGRATFVF